MKTSKKTYVAVASVLSAAAAEIGTMSSAAKIALGQAVASKIAEGLAEVFAADNPRFDRERFLKACDAT